MREEVEDAADGRRVEELHGTAQDLGEESVVQDAGRPQRRPDEAEAAQQVDADHDSDHQAVDQFVEEQVGVGVDAAVRHVDVVHLPGHVLFTTQSTQPVLNWIHPSFSSPSRFDRNRHHLPGLIWWRTISKRKCSRLEVGYVRRCRRRASEPTTTS